MFNYTTQEFQFLQSYLNEMYQTDMLRSGPMGDMIIGLRAKFLTAPAQDITEVERKFLLYALNDTFVTSRSPIVQSELGITMKFQSPRPDDYNMSPTKVLSSISDPNYSPSDMVGEGTYLTMWQVMINLMTKFGKVAPPPPVPFFPNQDQAGVETRRPNTNPDDRSIRVNTGDTNFIDNPDASGGIGR